VTGRDVLRRAVRRIGVARLDDRPEILTGALVWHPAGASRPLELDLDALFREAIDE
jgi:hypothetical protein